MFLQRNGEALWSTAWVEWALIRNTSVWLREDFPEVGTVERGGRNIL